GQVPLVEHLSEARRRQSHRGKPLGTGPRSAPRAVKVSGLKDLSVAAPRSGIQEAAALPTNRRRPLSFLIVPPAAAPFAPRKGDSNGAIRSGPALRAVAGTEAASDALRLWSRGRSRRSRARIYTASWPSS